MAYICSGCYTNTIMPRVQLFKREQALENAMQLFWKKGYNGTSTRDLEKATGLGTSSIYNSFGGKEALFFETLQHYMAAEHLRVNHSITGAPSALQALKALFECVLQAESALDARLMGCFLVNSVTEMANCHSLLNRFAVDARNATIHLLKELLIKAQLQKEIPETSNPEQLAVYLQTVMTGLKVTGMLTKDRKELQSIVEITLLNLTKE